MTNTQSTSDLAIRTRGLAKAYHIYEEPKHRLWQLLWPGQRRFYREFNAVLPLDLDVGRGETVGIVGRNGSGKSTLLKMICGTLEPTAGELQVDGHVVPLLTLGAGFDGEFTGRENVVMNAAVLGLSDEEIHDRLDSIRDFADIGDFFDQPVRSYSSGMYSRLAFAVAINADPDILVIDEVLAVGDEAFTRKCFARIEQIKKNGSTILFVSHSATKVIELCDRAVLMEAGQRLLTADPRSVITRYQKLIHAPADRVADIVEEVRELDNVLPIGGSPNDERSASTTEAPEAHSEPEQDYGYFDPGLKPKSTVEYEQLGACIHDVRILDPHGKSVNILRPGLIYTYAYETDFTKLVIGARFGMMLKLVTGFELGGQVSHPAGAGIEFIEPGSRAEVRFRFQTTLAPGAYFLNAGIVGFVDGEERYIHRILDALMFRIEAGEKSRVVGPVDLSNANVADVRITFASNQSADRAESVPPPG